VIKNRAVVSCGSVYVPVPGVWAHGKSYTNKIARVIAKISTKI